MPDTFFASVLDKNSDGVITHSLSQLPMSELAPDQILVKVACSSLNYKDALVYQGHPGIARHYPHVPGIDAAGTVVRSPHPDFPAGTAVIVTGFGLGTSAWGGHAEYIAVPADWLVRRPSAMSAEDSMALGTAGFTAALCVDALLRHDTRPEQGEILVSGASGGVGSVAVALLAQLGFQVAAVTRKPGLEAYFHQLGAQRTVAAAELAAAPERALHKEEYAGAIDTVGGSTLSTLLKRIRYGGSVAACGMAENANFSSTVFPFILRGVNLLGIDSVAYPQSRRQAIWDKLANEWRLPQLQAITQSIGLEEIEAASQAMLAGERTGRTVVVI